MPINKQQEVHSLLKKYIFTFLLFIHGTNKTLTTFTKSWQRMIIMIQGEDSRSVYSSHLLQLHHMVVLHMAHMTWNFGTACHSLHMLPHCLVISLVKVFQVTVQLLKSNLWTFTSLSYILPGIGFVAKLDKWKKTEAWIDRWFTFELNNNNNKSEGLPFQFICSVL